MSSHHLHLPFTILLSLLLHLTSSTPPPLPSHYTHHLTLTDPSPYIDPTHPSLLPSLPPTCSLSLLHHSFANTYSHPPFSTPFSLPPNCSTFSLAVLHLSVSSSGDQYDRVAAVWLDSSELLRTSTAEPTPSGVFWSVRKDITRHSSLLKGDAEKTISVMLENVVNDVYTGVFHVNVSLDLYEVEAESKVGASDLVVPVAEEDGRNGFWFRVGPGGRGTRKIRVPANAYRAVLEVFVSAHGSDEFWYSNPPNSYIERNRLDTDRGNGSFREVFVEIDGRFVGSIVPFPVVFTGGINPLFWAPVVGIGAFDLPVYDIELTPLLGWLLDGELHEFRFGVSDGIGLWLLDGNLHLWLDPHRSSTTARIVNYNAGACSVSRESEFENLDGKFKIEAEREVAFAGWVDSSFGNITTQVEQGFKFKSKVEFKRNGNLKTVHTISTSKSEVKMEKGDNVLMGQIHKSKFPIWVLTSMTPGVNDTYILKTNLSHAYYDETFTMVDGIGSYISVISDEQSAGGWMEVLDHDVLSGSTTTNQNYSLIDDSGCYLRSITTVDNVIKRDQVSTSCAFNM